MRFNLNLVLLLSTIRTCLASQLVFSPPSDSSLEASSSSVPSAQLSSPFNSTSKAIQWDKYSLVIAGRRQFLFCAEFHPFRQPSTDLWSDILDKIAAAGFNCVSIYLHWGLIQRSLDSELSFTGLNDLNKFLHLAESVGLFIAVRPGPYINAETTGGGLPPWLSRLDGVLRTDDENWEKAWKPYLQKVVEIVKPHQLTWDEKTGEVGGGGVVIIQVDNEYHSGPRQDKYMKELVRFLKSLGVTIPLTYNDSGRDENFVGLVDLWGYDSYPQRFDCADPSVWIEPPEYLSFHEVVTPNQPFYIPEYQAGSYDSYTGAGYPSCYEMTNKNFTRVANLNLWAQRVTILSLYMVYGGTNWGNVAEPDVYTSYDYGASITENRQLTEKYQEQKFQGLFLRSFPEMVRSERVDYVGRENDLLIRQLHNEESGSRFYFIQHKNYSSFERTSYEVEIETSYKKIKLPKDESKDKKLYLDGRDSRMIVTDKKLPNGAHVLYSSARIVFAGAVDSQDALVLLSEKGRRYETGWVVDGASFQVDSFSSSEDQDPQLEIGQTLQDGILTISWKVPETPLQSRMAYIRLSIGGVPVLLALGDEEAMSTFYAPIVSSSRVNESSPYPPQPSISHPPSLSAYNLLGSNSTVLISGAPLIRRAAYSVSGSTLHLWGQTDSESILDIFAPYHVMALTFNGEIVPFIRTSWGGIRTLDIKGLSKAIQDWKAPDLSKLDWKYSDSLPEIKNGFDDSDWISANKTSTFNPYFHSKSIKTEGQVLFAGEYGFHSGNILWRGEFEVGGENEVSGLSIQVEGGRSFAFSVWLNEVFLGSQFGNREKAAATLNVTFPSSSVKVGKNIITIVQDHMGYEMEYGALPIGLVADDDELEAFKLPRGIISYSLHSNISHPITWKVQGNVGGESPPDLIRTNFNEGGLFAERMGWHLQGFDDSNWESRTPWEGLKSSSNNFAGIGFFRSTFNLSLPSDVDAHDIALGFKFSNFSGAEDVGKYRTQLYVQGWQVGKLISDLGPQTYFPTGVLNFEGVGENTVAISLWSTGDEEIDSKLSGPIEFVIEAKWRGLSSKAENIGQGWNELRGNKGP